MRAGVMTSAALLCRLKLLETIRLFLLAQEQSVEIDNSNLIIYRLLPQANRSRTNGYLLALAGAGLASLR